MKRALITLLTLTSLSTFAGEKSLNKCQMTVDFNTMKIHLTNNIEKGMYVVEANCLDIVKKVSETSLEEVKISGVILDYTNP